MVDAINKIGSNIWGLVLLLIAAYFYQTHNGEAATAFFAAGATLMRIPDLKHGLDTQTITTGTDPAIKVTTTSNKM
jgi:hypothetical protein